MRVLHVIIVICLSGFSTFVLAQISRTQVVLLGTGNPNPEPDRFGPSVAIVVDKTPYVIDCGPGVVRRASAAVKKGVDGLNSVFLNRLFITHLHSDHTSGYPDFLLTPAVLERRGPLLVFGPTGTKNMDYHIRQAYLQDFKIRIFGLELGDSTSYKTEVTEIKEGIIYRDSFVTVKAIKVPHGGWEESYAFKFTTPDRVIVVSGDCTFSEKLMEESKGCDILIHEVFSEDGWSRRPSKWKTYHKNFHTSTSQLATLANYAKPKKLVLYHQLLWDSSEEKLMKEISSKYSGEVIYGRDLDIIQ